MIDFARSLLRRKRYCPATHVPTVRHTTYHEQGNQWYRPLLAGPSSLISATVGGHAVREVLTVLERLSADKYMDFVLNFYRAGLDRFGDNWVYADINTVLFGLARVLQPSAYLEIGVRRGRSMAVVVSQASDCHAVGFDLWIPDYAGMENPGPEFVRRELVRVANTGRLEFVDGDSKQTVPMYFRQNPDIYFDLLTVDGDHSVSGAEGDLSNVMERVKIGGALVFDDVANQDHPGLRAVWDKVVGNNPAYASYAFDEIGFGVAFGIRKY